MKVHVLTHKAEILSEKLEDKVVLVLDILFATSSIVTAMANGCELVIPTQNSELALAKSKVPAYSKFVLSGELNADTLQGFSHPTPVALLKTNIKNNGLIYCTTNGTVALHASQSASSVYAASLLNGKAIVDKIKADHQGATVLIVCSGSQDRFNLEDFFGAGQLVSYLNQNKHFQNVQFSDSAIAAKHLYENGNGLDILRQSRVGQMMISRNLDDEIKFAAQENITNVIPKLSRDGLLRLV
jgi:2-phosphosulfolactate phosphatase